MKIRTIATALTIAGSTALATAVPAQSAQAAGQHTGTASLASVLAADGHHFDHNWGDFDIVDKAVGTVLKAKPGSDVAVLADGHKRVTAFLPTDAAFRRLVTDLTGQKKKTERGVFRAVTKNFDVDTIEAVLLYHVVPGKTITYAQARKADGASLATALAGAAITVKKRDGLVKLRDLDPDAGNAWVIPAASDINKGNKQIAHGISRVLRPVDL